MPARTTAGRSPATTLPTTASIPTRPRPRSSKCGRRWWRIASRARASIQAATAMASAMPWQAQRPDEDDRQACS